MGYIILSEAKTASGNQFAAQKTCLLSEAENMLPISYITEGVFFPTQIIVTNELDGELHTWLKPLSDSAGEEDMLRLLRKTSRLEGKYGNNFIAQYEILIRLTNHCKFD